MRACWLLLSFTKLKITKTRRYILTCCFRQIESKIVDEEKEEEENSELLRLYVVLLWFPYIVVRMYRKLILLVAMDTSDGLEDGPPSKSGIIC